MIRYTLIACVALAALPVSAAEEPVAVILDWNDTVLTLAEAEDGFLTLKGLRTAAMMPRGSAKRIATTMPPMASSMV